MSGHKRNNSPSHGTYLPNLALRLHWVAMTLLLLICGTRLSAGDTMPSVDAVRILATQNLIRRQLGLSPLVWSPRLAAIAQDWADTLVAKRNFHHKANNPFGENLFLIEGRVSEGDEVARRWAEESADYDPSTNSCHSVCGHYTQMVWRDTRHTGCASSTADGRQIWVCEYDPAGNYTGERPY